MSRKTDSTQPNVSAVKIGPAIPKISRNKQTVQTFLY